MSKKNSFYRKIAYLCGIAILIVPISLISAPAASRTQGGGELSQLRREYKLSQAQLGKIDPASASMSLATLGMRGVAANLLWQKAIESKKKEDWDVLKATLNQITKLQPNFVSVWQFQAWNISYNVSVEFDDFRHRYHWVKKGIDYLLEGTEYNEGEPLLLWDAGWFFGHKMGRADEYKQFRRLFREDDDFHQELAVDLNEVRGADGRPDNWLCGRWFFLDAQRAADRGARIKRLATYYWMENERIIEKKQTPLRGKNPLIFHSDPPKALINYADAISEEGQLGEVSKIAWEQAGKEWNDYGNREIITSDGTTIHLNDLDRALSEVKAAEDGLAELCGGIREEIIAERRAKLPPEQLEALDTIPPERTEEQYSLALQANNALQVSFKDIADRAPPEIREQALALAKRGLRNQILADWVERYREIVNFTYWETRCEAEQQDNTIAARRKLLDALEAFADADLEGAREKFEDAWDRWAVVFDEYPVLVRDVEGEDVAESVLEYQKLLGQLDEPFPPKDFKLMKLLEVYVENYDELMSAVEAADALEVADAEAEDGEAEEEAADLLQASETDGQDDSSATEMPTDEPPRSSESADEEADPGEASTTAVDAGDTDGKQSTSTADEPEATPEATESDGNEEGDDDEDG